MNNITISISVKAGGDFEIKKRLCLTYDTPIITSTIKIDLQENMLEFRVIDDMWIGLCEQLSGE